jgi:hypothetical protein
MDDRANNYTGVSSIELFLNGASQGIYSNSSTSNNLNTWQQVTVNFQATQVLNTIKFQNATAAGDNFAGLDDVFLDIAGVPEPATFGLMTLALGSAAILRRRLIRN